MLPVLSFKHLSTVNVCRLLIVLMERINRWLPRDEGALSTDYDTGISALILSG